MQQVKILELFGGIGSPRIALKRLGVPVKAIDYVEIDEKAVRSYNAMFENELSYKPQTVVGWNLKPDILIHGSPCQDISIAGHQGKQKGEGRVNHGRGADEGSETRSSLMWETLKIIRNMGLWKPRAVIWENVKNVKGKRMLHNFNRYLTEMELLGYTSRFQVLNARDFGLPQNRERCFTVSLIGKPFNFDKMQRSYMKPLSNYLEPNVTGYEVTQPSILSCIGSKGIRRATVIKDYAMTITCRQDRTPAQILPLGDGKYRFLTERECWRLMGYNDTEFEAAARVNTKRTLYKQAGNSIPVPVIQEILRVILKGC